MLTQYSALAFVPAPSVWAWALETFVEESGPLHNPEHAHLAQAKVGVLWTTESNRRRGRTVLGTAEILRPEGNRWQKARAEYQLRTWFGFEPDFLVTLYAPWCSAAPNAEFCRLVEHECLHCGQAEDDFGAPRFNKFTGKPVFALRGHDLEIFHSELERYGPRVVGPDAVELVRLAGEGPAVAAVDIRAACGTALGRVA